MKRVLITGAESYVGTKVRARLELQPELFDVTELDVKDSSWREFDFSGYDCVYHVAGIAHVSADSSMESLYMSVNRDLAIEVGRKAKAAGVRQFIFMSSAIVYGDAVAPEQARPITRETPINPSNYYGLSKVEAEIGLMELASTEFRVAVLRCPMIYGPGCKGNFPRLAKLAQTIPVFPDVKNRRSILYVGNLAELVVHLVDTRKAGLFLPQDGEPLSTAEIVALCAKATGHRLRTQETAVSLDALARVLPRCARRLVQKAFNSLYYGLAASDCGFAYQMIPTEEAIRISLCGNKAEELETPTLSTGHMAREDASVRMPRPKVSISTVTYNSEKTLAKAIDSVLVQDYRPLEYIIVDGSSTDDTVAIAKSYAPRFREAGIDYRVVSEPDEGMYDAINKAMDMAAGEIIGNVNSDDYYEPNAVRVVVEHYLDSGFDVFQGSVRIQTPRRTIVKKATPMGRWENTRGFNHPTMFLAGRGRELRYRTDNPYADFDLFLRAVRRGYSVLYAPEVISNFVFGGISTKKSLKGVRERIGWRYQVFHDNSCSPLAYVEGVLAEYAKYVGA